LLAAFAFPVLYSSGQGVKDHQESFKPSLGAFAFFINTFWTLNKSLLVHEFAISFLNALKNPQSLLQQIFNLVLGELLIGKM